MPYLKVTLRRPVGKTHPIEEMWVGMSGSAVSRGWGVISLAAEVALEKKRFVAFSDTGVAGWQTHQKEIPPKYMYCVVALYESDQQGDNDDDPNDDDD
jgi:hypothetical protein